MMNPNDKPKVLSGPILSVLAVVLFGIVGEFWALMGPIRIFSLPTSSQKDDEYAEIPNVPAVVGESEISSDSIQQTAPVRLGSSQQPRKADLFNRKTPPALPIIEAEAPPVKLLNPSGHSLDHFFRALVKSQRKEEGAITRIAHFGDSIVVSDFVSGTLRRKLQETFGDSGHGYMLIANAWPAYSHNDVYRFATKGFRVSRIVGPLSKDGLYGLGGVTFRANSGIIARFGTSKEGEFGKNVSRFELSYLAKPHGGKFEISVDGNLHREVDSRSDNPEVRRIQIDVADGPHEFEYRSRRGESRTFGVVLERNSPGVVLDALGVQGARIRFLDKQNDEHFAQELQWRRPDLLIYQFGANESSDGYAFPMDEYLLTMEAVIKQGKKALPNSSCLIIGAMDRARRRDGVTSSMKIIQLIIKEQEQAAHNLDCAYFDTYAAMGGWGSMPRWVKRGLGQADMTHPSEIGALRIGNWIYQALMKSYTNFLKDLPPN